MGGTISPADARDPATFSPDGDGQDDKLIIDQKLSEKATLSVEVRSTSGDLVRHFTVRVKRGRGQTTWDGRNDAHKVVPDGTYRVKLTPKDAAGNVGQTGVVVARVLTTLGQLTSSREGIDVKDGDRLAGSVTLSVHLRSDANVTWQILDRDNHVVATRYDTKGLHAGDLQWVWRGTRDNGKVVHNGWYKATITSTTKVGKVTRSVPIFVGAFRIDVSDGTPARGDRLTVTLTSSEKLKSPPTIVVTQPGVKPRTVDTTAGHGGVYTATFKLSSKGDPGTLGLAVSGTDINGGAQSSSRSIHIH